MKLRVVQLYGSLRRRAGMALARKSKSYSQLYEDALIEWIGKMFEVRISSYIDIGGHDPRYLNNTYRFYKQGARGVIVDPNPRFRKLYSKYRPDDVFINAAVGESGDATQTFFVFDTDELSTTNVTVA
jgi:hypothetical protein